MEPLNIHLVERALELAGRAFGDADSARMFAQHYAVQVQERYGEDSTEFEEADKFHRLAHEMREAVQTHLSGLQNAEPAVPRGHA